MTNLRIPNFAAVTTWGPNNDYVVNMYQSKLYLTPIAGTMLAHSGEVVPSWSEYKGDPFWSQDGKYLVFTSFDMPDMGMYNDTGLNGDMKRRGQIVIATAEDTQVHDDAKVLVARQSGVTSYYPVISNDSKLIAFVRSTCGSDPDVLGSGYGSQSCDGYDDSTGQLWLTAPDGRTAINLGRANGSGSNDNSWPRWSPDNGMFRGQHLYWLAFSTRRPYGLQANTGGLSSSKPQIWLAAILTGSEVGGDPSYAPVWLPNQNPVPMMPNGNHVPQWVKVAIVIPG
jgi:Tol biopolymer transport system component